MTNSIVEVDGRTQNDDVDENGTLTLRSHAGRGGSKSSGN